MLALSNWYTTNRTSLSDVWGLRRLNSNTSSRMTEATKRGSKPNLPTPIGGMASDVILLLSVSCKQLLTNLLRTCKNTYYIDYSQTMHSNPCIRDICRNCCDIYLYVPVDVCLHYLLYAQKALGIRRTDDIIFITLASLGYNSNVQNGRKFQCELLDLVHVLILNYYTVYLITQTLHRQDCLIMVVMIKIFYVMVM